MPSLLSLTPLADSLSRWWWRHFSNNQWLVDREQIRIESYTGWLPRIVLARSLCLFFTCDLTRVPKSRRNSALLQQIALHAPFPDTGHYATWFGATACVWVWDQAALVVRLPEAAEFQIVPDSALSVAPFEGERFLSGIQGSEWQSWQQGVLLDSRWLSIVEPTSQPIMLSRRTSLRASDRVRFGHLACALLAWCLLLGILWQAGSTWKAISQIKHLSAVVAASEEGLLDVRHARQRAEGMRRQYEAWLALLGPGQSSALPQLMEKLPASVTKLIRYEYQPLRLQMVLTDNSPDPREYVNRLEGVTVNDRRLYNVQVQLERNQQVRLQADLQLMQPSVRGKP